MWLTTMLDLSYFSKTNTLRLCTFFFVVTAIQQLNAQNNMATHDKDTAVADTITQAQELDNESISYCVVLGLNQSNYIIKNQEELENAVRKDASSNYCMKRLPKINWNQYILVGNSISSGSCHRPSGLSFTYNYTKETNTIYLDIYYYENQPLCRALSLYSYWLLLPKSNDSTSVITRYNTIDNR